MMYLTTPDAIDKIPSDISSSDILVLFYTADRSLPIQVFDELSSKKVVISYFLVNNEQEMFMAVGALFMQTTEQIQILDTSVPMPTNTVSEKIRSLFPPKAQKPVSAKTSLFDPISYQKPSEPAPASSPARSDSSAVSREFNSSVKTISENAARENVMKDKPSGFANSKLLQSRQQMNSALNKTSQEKKMASAIKEDAERLMANDKSKGESDLFFENPVAKDLYNVLGITSREVGFSYNTETLMLFLLKAGKDCATDDEMKATITRWTGGQGVWNAVKDKLPEIRKIAAETYVGDTP